jgi:hypothetical protein
MTAAASWATAIRRAGERVELARPDGTSLGETWAKLAPLSAEALTDTAAGARYTVRFSPGLLPPGAAAHLSTVALRRGGGEILRAFGALVSIRHDNALVAYELTMVGAA